MEKGRPVSRSGASRKKLHGPSFRLFIIKRRKWSWLSILFSFLVLLALIQLAQPLLLNTDNWLAILGRPFLKNAEQRTAVCLSGGARSFELTGPSIKEHLLTAYPNTDVFLVIPFDQDTHKLSLLAGVGNIVRAHVSTQSLILEDDINRELFDEYGSPNGVQGLLQYFALIETCQQAILDHERANRFRYTWILRTRPDGFWNAPPPPLHTFEPKTYYVPNGVDFDGVNDRLAFGARNVVIKMLARSSTIRELWAAGLRSANSEIALKAQLRIRDVKLKRLDFPFCVITRRTFPFVDRPEEVPVVPIGSAVTLNGVYCKPCTPMLTGQAAFNKMGSYRKSLRWFGKPREGAEICNSTAEWEDGWERAFDAKVGTKLARQREFYRNETLDACKERVGGFIKEVPMWRGPSARDLCLSYLLGKPRQVMQVKMYLPLLRGPSDLRSTAIALSRTSRVGIALASASTYTGSAVLSPESASFCRARKKCRYPDADESSKMIQGLPRKVYIGLLEVPGMSFASRLASEMKASPDLRVCQLVLTYHDAKIDVQEWGALKSSYEELGFWQVSCEWTTRKEARCLLVSNRHCNIKFL